MGMSPTVAWQFITKALSENEALCARSHRVTGVTGIVPNHAYAVTGVEEVAGERFVRLRNPRGDDERSPPRVVSLEVFVSEFGMVSAQPGARTLQRPASSSRS